MAAMSMSLRTVMVRNSPHAPRQEQYHVVREPKRNELGPLAIGWTLNVNLGRWTVDEIRFLLMAVAVTRAALTQAHLGPPCRDADGVGSSCWSQDLGNEYVLVFFAECSSSKVGRPSRWSPDFKYGIRIRDLTDYSASEAKRSCAQGQKGASHTLKLFISEQKMDGWRGGMGSCRGSERVWSELARP